MGYSSSSGESDDTNEENHDDSTSSSAEQKAVNVSPNECMCHPCLLDSCLRMVHALQTLLSPPQAAPVTVGRAPAPAAQARKRKGKGQKQKKGRSTKKKPAEHYLPLSSELEVSDGRLRCKCCHKLLRHKTHNVKSHLKSKSHTLLHEQVETTRSRQQSVAVMFEDLNAATGGTVTAEVHARRFAIVEALLEACIPLYRLDQPKLREVLMHNAPPLT